MTWTVSSVRARSCLAYAMRQAGSDYRQLASQINVRTGRAAQLFLGALPVMLVYPFLQKYFTTGLTLGSVKG